MRGTIVKLVRDRGYGFLAPVGGGGNIFFHALSCIASLDTVKEGDKATFTITTQASGKAEATAIRVLQPSSLPAAAEQVACVQVPNRGKISAKPVPLATKASPVLQPSPLPAVVKQGAPARAPDCGNIAAKVAKPMPTKAPPGAGKGMVKTRNSVTEKQHAQQRRVRDSWPKPRAGEIELVIDEPWSFAPTQQLRSESLAVQNFQFNILAFPKGTKSRAGQFLGAFVEALPGDVEPDSVFEEVRFEILVVNWSDFRKSRSFRESFAFKASGAEIDRGWHDLLTMNELKQGSSWVGPAGSVCIRARCVVAETAHWT
jgi:cold shock CspA family protein